MVNNEEHAGDIILASYNEKVLQNLKDADCDSSLIKQFFNLEQSKQIKGAK